MKYVIGIILLASILFCYDSVSAQTSTPQEPRPKPTPPKPKVELAVWNDNAEKSFGITEKDFKSMGLGKLTADEYTQFLGWVIARESESEIKGMDEGRKAFESTSSTYSCGPDKTNGQSLSKVNLFIVNEENTPSEIMSGLRQRLRNMSDIQIVFDRKEADLVIDVSAFEVKPEGGGRTMGYAAATTVTIPCTWKIGTENGVFGMYQDGFLNTSNSIVAGLVDSIVTTIDSHDIETVRQQNAMWKKIRENSNK